MEGTLVASSVLYFYICLLSHLLFIFVSGLWLISFASDASGCAPIGSQAKWKIHEWVCSARRSEIRNVTV